MNRCSHCDIEALSDPCSDCHAAGHRDPRYRALCEMRSRGTRHRRASKTGRDAGRVTPAHWGRGWAELKGT